MKTQIFKPYAQKQMMILPPNLEEMIPENHLVRVVDKMVEELDKKIVWGQYKGGGTSAYDPIMLLKATVLKVKVHLQFSRRFVTAL